MTAIMRSAYSELVAPDRVSARPASRTAARQSAACAPRTTAVSGSGGMVVMSVRSEGGGRGDAASRHPSSGFVEAVLDELGELLAVVERQERRRGGVELERLEIVEVVAERVAEQRQLAAQGRAALQPVVGVHGDSEAELVEQVERVVDEFVAPRRDRAGLQVRGRTRLEGDLTVAHPLGDRTERDIGVLVVLTLDHQVFGDAHAVPEAEGAPVEQGAPNGVEPVGLARVHGDRQELA